VDPVSGVLVVSGGRRLHPVEVTMIRQAIEEGRGVAFVDRHQWRHFQIRRL
jgi:hypothetical protein